MRPGLSRVLCGRFQKPDAMTSTGLSVFRRRRSSDRLKRTNLATPTHRATKLNMICLHREVCSFAWPASLTYRLLLYFLKQKISTEYCPKPKVSRVAREHALWWALSVAKSLLTAACPHLVTQTSRRGLAILRRHVKRQSSFEKAEKLLTIVGGTKTSSFWVGHNWLKRRRRLFVVHKTICC